MAKFRLVSTNIGKFVPFSAYVISTILIVCGKILLLPVPEVLIEPRVSFSRVMNRNKKQVFRFVRNFLPFVRGSDGLVCFPGKGQIRPFLRRLLVLRAFIRAAGWCVGTKKQITFSERKHPKSKKKLSSAASDTIEGPCKIRYPLRQRKYTRSFTTFYETIAHCLTVCMQGKLLGSVDVVSFPFFFPPCLVL